MTNKEKYPNARILENESATYDCDGQFYIRLLSDEYVYLRRDGSVGPHDCSDARNTYHKTRQDAQDALDKFMNEKPEITLSEIKSQYEEAKKLIGNKIKDPDGRTFVVKDVSLHVEFRSSSYVCNEFFEKNGYVIKVSNGKGTAIPYVPDISIFKEISVKAHDGQTYTAESDGDCWKFGCARIDKSLIKNASELFEKLTVGNRQVKKITIGACDFDEETLKSLVELKD